MENETENDQLGSEEKLIPEWSQSGDNQIIFLGLLVLVILALAWGWSNATDDGPLADVGNTFGIESDSADTPKEPTDDDEVSAAPSTTVAPEVELEVGDLAGAMAAFGVTGTADGDKAILTGYVGSAAESAAVEASATRVFGINTVDNRLVVLEPLVEDALRNAGVTEVESSSVAGTTATAVGYVDDEAHRAEALLAVSAVDGVTGAVADELIVLDADVLEAANAAGVADASVTVSSGVATVSGQVVDEAAREAALDAALVPGVSEVIDRLVVAEPTEPPPPEGTDTRDELNALFEANPIQFNSGSAVIKEESFGVLDSAVDLLSETEAAFEVQGYTDITGNAASNQKLSEDRAAAVVNYLVSKGVAGSQLEAKGYGPTEQFGDLAANRRVRFELI